MENKFVVRFTLFLFASIAFVLIAWLFSTKFLYRSKASGQDVTFLITPNSLTNYSNNQTLTLTKNYRKGDQVYVGVWVSTASKVSALSMTLLYNPSELGLVAGTSPQAVFRNSCSTTYNTSDQYLSYIPTHTSPLNKELFIRSERLSSTSSIYKLKWSKSIPVNNSLATGLFCVGTLVFEVRTDKNLDTNISLSDSSLNPLDYEVVGIKATISSSAPTVKPSIAPTVKPSIAPTVKPSIAPTVKPSIAPTVKPSIAPTVRLSINPRLTIQPSFLPTGREINPPVNVLGVETMILNPILGMPSKIVFHILNTLQPTNTPVPTVTPRITPSVTPTVSPTVTPRITPSVTPTVSPTVTPVCVPGSHRSFGDANNDCKITLSDYQIWLSEFIYQIPYCSSKKETLPTICNEIISERFYSDFSGELKVSLLDFEIWRSNYVLTIVASPTIKAL